MKRKTLVLTVALSLVLSTVASVSALEYWPARLGRGVHIGATSPSQPVAPEAALVLAREWLPSQMFRLMLPITFSIEKPLPSSPESTALVISDIQFLGVADDWSKAKAIAVAVPGTTSTAAMSNVLTANDKDTDLKAVGTRLLQSAGSPDWFVVMSMTAQWTPWHLELTARNAEVVRRTGATSSPPAYVEGALLTAEKLPKLLDLDLSNIQAPIDSTHVLNLNIAMSFGVNSITLGLVPSSVASSWKIPPPGLTGLMVESTGALPNTSVVFSIPHSFINGIITLMYQGSSIPVGGGLVFSSLSTATFKDATLCPNTCFTITGALNNGNEPAVRVAVDWSGNDLRFWNARVVKNLCPSKPACQLLEVQARAGALKMKSDFSKPTPRFMRPETVRHLGKFTIGGKPMTLNLLIQNVQVTSSGLYASGFAALLGR